MPNAFLRVLEPAREESRWPVRFDWNDRLWARADPGVPARRGRSRRARSEATDRRDFAPVGYQRVNKVTGKEVPWEETVKGYEHADGEYVVLTDAELKTANAEASRQVDIEDFVDFAAIDPRLIERPYYLAPQ